MRIVLINPSQNTRYPLPPLSLAYIAASLDDHKVRILDLNLTDDLRDVKNADVLGFTAMTSTMNTAVNLARTLKRVFDVSVIFGGPHVTINPVETLLKVPEIDIIVVGEGENTVRNLFNVLESGKTKLDSVEGIAYRDNRKIKVTRRKFIEDLDNIPYPAYHLLPIRKYVPYPPHGSRLPFMAMFTSRGCPYRCVYCSKPVWGNKFRTQSPQRIVNEIKYLKEKFGVNELIFYDDTFTINRKRIVQLCNIMIEDDIDIIWSCETRVNLVDKELLNLMRKAGCYIISYGVESGSQRILDSLKKDITIEQSKSAFKLSREIGIQTVGYFMIGSPGETLETIHQTINFSKELDADFAQFSITTPFPGTELYEMYNCKTQNWDDFVYARVKSFKPPTFETENLTREELMYWSRKAYIEFYIRPRYILKRLIQIKNFKTTVKGFGMFLDMLG
jgi:radical SAM superfamily enzyme YgiQ (UPF0313 family)